MIVSIQYLRAVAALFVVAYHAAVKLEQNAPVFAVGQSGVDLFFIISGFVITLVATRSPETDPSVFLRRRLIRVVPIYWIITLVYAGALLAIPAAFQTHQFSLARVAVSLAFWPSSELPIVYTGWSLVFEMYFYLLFALALVIARHRAPWLAVAVLTVSWLVGLVSSGPQPPWLNLVTSHYLIEFVVGITTCLAYRRGFRISHGPAIAAFALAVGCAVVLHDAHPRLAYGLPWTLVFIASVLSPPISTRIPMLGLLGDASYSIYLIHPLVLPTLHAVVTRSGIDVGPLTGLWLPAYIVVSTGAGVLFYQAVERPVMQRLRDRLAADGSGGVS